MQKNLLINIFVFLSWVILLRKIADIRNSKIEKLLESLVKGGIQTTIWDPVMNKDQFFCGSKFEFTETLPSNKFDVIVGAVKHKEFLDLPGKSLEKCLKQKRLVLDIKNF